MSDKEKKYSQNYVKRLEAQIRNLKKSGETINSGYEKHRTNSEQESHKRSFLDYFNHGINTTLAIGTIIIAIYAVNQANIAKSAIETTEISVKIANRAYIGFTDPEIVNDVIDSFSVKAVIINAGNTPGYITNVHTRFFCWKDIINMDIVKNMPIDSLFKENIQITINPKIEQQGILCRITEHDKPPVNIVEKVIKEKLFIYLYVFVAYSDIFNADRHSIICYKFHINPIVDTNTFSIREETIYESNN